MKAEKFGVAFVLGWAICMAWFVAPAVAANAL